MSERFSPQSKIELPPRMGFAQQMIDANERLCQAGIDLMTAQRAFDQDQIDDIRRFGYVSFSENPSLSGAEWDLTGKVVPVSMMGSDSVILENLYSPISKENDIRELQVTLMRDGSGYVPDEHLVDESVALEPWWGPTYIIFSAYELPPTAVLINYLEITANDLNKNWQDPAVIRDVKERYGEQVVHEITDEECASLTAAISQLGGHNVAITPLVEQAERYRIASPK